MPCFSSFFCVCVVTPTNKHDDAICDECIFVQLEKVEMRHFY